MTHDFKIVEAGDFAVFSVTKEHGETTYLHMESFPDRQEAEKLIARIELLLIGHY